MIFHGLKCFLDASSMERIAGPASNTCLPTGEYAVPSIPSVITIIGEVSRFNSFFWDFAVLCTVLLHCADNQFLGMFEAIFDPTHAGSPMTISQLESSSSIELLLDTHQSDIFGTDRGSFWLRLTQAHDQFDISDGTLVEAGRKSVFHFSHRVCNLFWPPCC